MKRLPLKNNVKNSDLVKSLKISIERNEDALDYLENKINQKRDMLSYLDYDKGLNDEINILEHIKFSLSFLSDKYNETLRSLS